MEQQQLAAQFSSMRPLERARLSQRDPTLYARMRTSFENEKQRLISLRNDSKNYSERRACTRQLQSLAQGTASHSTLDTAGRILAFVGPEPTPHWVVQARASSTGVLDLDIHDDIGASAQGGGTTSEKIVEMLRETNASLIRVSLNSRGGDVEDGIAIYNRLVAHPARVEVTVDGIAASIASVIAMAGDDRAMFASSRMMVHDPWTLALGSSENLRKKAGVLDKVRDQMVDIYVARTGKSAAAIKQLMADETWMNAAEAVQEGFADRVVEHRRRGAQ